MNKNKQFDDILDKCLERMRQGASIEQCLAAYPEQAKELRPLLETAAMVKQAAAVSPRPDLQAQLQYRLHAAAQEHPDKKRISLLGWSPRWATGVGIALVMVMAGGSTVAAASSAMPDSTLYPVKQATEEVRMKLTFSDVSKAELYAKIADERMNELDYLASKPEAEKPERTEKIERVRRNMNTALDKVVVLAAPAPKAVAGIMVAPRMTTPPPSTKEDRETRVAPPAAIAPAPRPMQQAGKAAVTSITTEQQIKRAQMEDRLTDLSKKRDALEKALEHAPNPRAKLAIEQAIKVSEKGYGRALEELQKTTNENESP